MLRQVFKAIVEVLGSALEILLEMATLGKVSRIVN